VSLSLHIKILLKKISNSFVIQNSLFIASNKFVEIKNKDTELINMQIFYNI